MEACEEEMDQLQSTMNKKVKNLYDQLEDALQEKQAAVKVCSLFVCHICLSTLMNLLIVYLHCKSN